MFLQYASSKAGVQGLVLSLGSFFRLLSFDRIVVLFLCFAAREFVRFGIRVQAISPTMFSTPMGNAVGTNNKLHADLLEATLFPRRYGEPNEFAHLALFIIENQMMNGLNLYLI